MDAYDSLALKRIRETIEATIETIAAGLVSGAAASFEEYREQVGALRGLRVALDHIEDTRRALSDRNKDD